MNQKYGIFLHKDYKHYLNEALEIRSQTQKGQRLKLANHLNCEPSFISQVLNKNLDLSGEQAMLTNAFLGHTESEGQYFLNLVLLARAGNQPLKRYYQDELKRLSENHLLIKNRVKSNRTLSIQQQAKYYSSWYFAAVHVIVSLPNIRTKEQIAEALYLPLSTVSEVLEFLIEIGLLKYEKGHLAQGETSLFLGADSDFFTKNQLNWRVEALKSLDSIKKSDLHYSGVITCSEADVLKIREILARAIEEIRSVVRASSDETLYAYTLDLFGLLKK